jgi:hypothetical protein
VSAVIIIDTASESASQSSVESDVFTESVVETSSVPDISTKILPKIGALPDYPSDTAVKDLLSGLEIFLLSFGMEILRLHTV